jgi:hypothetical protein
MISPALLTLLANTPPTDPLDKILPWVTTFVLGVLGLVFGKVWGKREATATRLEDPVPTVPTRKVPGIVTWDHLQPLIQRMDRLERHIDDVRKEQSDQFKELLEAGAAREQRLVDKVDDVARAIHSRIDDHLPRPRSPR